MRREREDRAKGEREHRDTQRRGRNRTPRRGPGRAVQREFAARFEQGKLGLGRRRQIVDDVADDLFARNRSEEHTSELQSLMRTSYAVFCLKKKNKQTSSNRNKVTKLTDTRH